MSQFIQVYQGHPGNVETTAYTTPVGKTLLITAIRVANTSGVDATASYGIVGSGGTGGVTNRLAGGVTVLAHDVISDTDWHVVPSTSFISLIASTTDVVFTISGALV